MAYVEGRQPPLALQAAAVLWKECIEALSAGAAGIVNRLGKRVVRSQAETFAEAPRKFHACGVVACLESVIDKDRTRN